MFTFDIKTCMLKQELLRNLQVHELIIQLANYLSLLLAQQSKRRKPINMIEKEIILEKCLLTLIFFCIKNFKNSNLIARHPSFRGLIKNLLEVEQKSLQNYVFILITELYKDNYNLMIDILSQKDQLIQDLFLKFQLSYDRKDFQFCINFMQVFSYFYQVKSASLLQN
jgi:RIH domain